MTELPLRRLSSIAGVLLAAATMLASAAAASALPAPPVAPIPPVSPPTASADVVLSNETTSTTWVTADYARPVFAQPSTHSRRVTRLRFVTSDGFLQSYIALRERHTVSGDWVQLRLPMRPNGLTGWVSRGALDTFNMVHTQLVLDRAQRRLTLFRDGTQVLSAPIGIGKPSTPTPPGHFWITEKFAVHNSPVYGPYAFGTSDYSVLTDWPGGGVIGLHGTNEPQLVPGTPSHGCVRLHNGDVRRLSRLVPLGTPLLIR